MTLEVVVKTPRPAEAGRVERHVRMAFHETVPKGAWTVTCLGLDPWPLYYVTVVRDGEVVRRFVRPEKTIGDELRSAARSAPPSAQPPARRRGAAVRGPSSSKAV